VIDSNAEESADICSMYNLALAYPFYVVAGRKHTLDTALRFYELALTLTEIRMHHVLIFAPLE
jgi:hypothetical protein